MRRFVPFRAGLLPDRLRHLGRAFLPGLAAPVLAAPVLAAVVCAPGAAQAVDRAAVTGGELRLLTGLAIGAEVSMGVEIALEPGWKTYWRSPGDSGIPPSIDTAGSVNVAAVVVDFPAPVRFADGNGESVGYKGPVVLPLRVRLADPTRPATISAKLFVGLCREICVPAEADLAVTVTPGVTPRPQAIAAIAAAKARLPRPPQDGRPFAVTALRRVEGGKAVEIEVGAPEPAPGLDLFVEGPEGWALPLAAPSGPEGTRRTWRVALEGVPKAATIEGATLRLTLTDGRRAVEQSFDLP